MENDKKELKAIHERDLDNLLIKVSKKEEFYNGNIKCKFCKEIVTKTNLYSLFCESGSVNFICDNSICISEFMNYIANKKEKSNQ